MRAAMALGVLVGLVLLAGWLLSGEGVGPARRGPAPRPATAAPDVTPPTEPAPEIEPAPRIKPAPSRRRVAARPATKPAGSGRPSAAGTVAAPPAPAREPSVAPATEAALRYSVDADGIRTAVRDAAPEIKACYTAWLKTGAELEGALSVRFTVEASDTPQAPGRVTEAALVASELAHPFMEGCVLDVMQGLNFEAPTSGKVTVNYPFNFVR